MLLQLYVTLDMFNNIFEKWANYPQKAANTSNVVGKGGGVGMEN